ncbi:mandelate racemase/muconate lactonizing enzyme family protein [Microlunatus sp. Y2014]|uniref:mandelate racemase/muconate lactonizing enzyme family protein n=1 Tax=Microlunatus sp. Y2014 TaxID=3418488 RepID=UPI003DA78223
MKVTRVRQWEAAFGYYNAHYVRIETDDGAYGVSEVGMRRRTRTLSALITELGEYLVGKDATAIEQHHERMWRDSFTGGTLLGQGIAALNNALWDLNARSLGVPVHRLLGGTFRDRVPVYTHARATDTPEGFADGVAERVAQGFTAIKTTLPGFYTKVSSIAHEVPAQVPARQTETEPVPGRVIDRIGDWFAAARDRVGPDVKLMIDCHGRLSVANAIRLCRVLEPYDLAFVEEPVPPDDPAWIREVAARTDIPIATGERWANHYAAAPFLSGGGLAIAQPDVAWCGGISGAQRIAHLAETHAIGVAFHNPFGPLASAAAWHLGATLPNMWLSESMLTPEQLPQWTKYVTDAPVVENGAWVPTQTPGLGPDLDIDAIEANPANYDFDRGGTR